jgi:GDPmannose 4,6-dehydratase
MKRALITGITGQDGSYLAELLLEKGYEVHGIVRRMALERPEHRLWRIRHLQDRVVLHSGCVEHLPSLHRIVRDVNPVECYHLAAQSFVGNSFDDEFTTMQVNVAGTHHVLSELRDCAGDCRVYFAASSEMFGKVSESPQHEQTPFHPRSVYGITKVAGFNLARLYREAYGMHVSSGILFNHESSRRGMEFVTRKITSAAAKIACGQQKELVLGNMEARRDWGHAKDYVRAMWLMLQQDSPDDYVIATGQQHSVREFAEETFRWFNDNWAKYVKTASHLHRRAEVDSLCGDASKAKRLLGWEPTVSFSELVSEMAESDWDLIS